MDEELAKRGDKEAYKRLIEKYKKYLFNIAISILKNEEDSGDAISETIIKGYENVSNLREPQFFKTWITRILINESNKILNARGKIISMEEWQYQVQDEKEYISREEIVDLRKALNNLSKEQYSVVMLFYYNDLKIEEIAEILKVPSGTVKSRLNTARERLYEQLTQGKESEHNG